MTVDGYTASLSGGPSSDVICKWFAGNAKNESGTFHENSLEAADPNEVPI
jgi:uncharacterized protein YodC (DUF2158 family)